MHVTSEDGDFFFKSNGVEDSSAEVPVCGLYLITEANMRVELTIRHFDVPCEDGGLIAVSFNYFIHYTLNIFSRASASAYFQSKLF